MDLIKSKTILGRLQALFNTLESNPQISSLERDLILNYLRELYEQVLESQIVNIPMAKSKTDTQIASSEKEGTQKTLDFRFETMEENLSPAIPLKQTPIVDTEPFIIPVIPKKEEEKPIEIKEEITYTSVNRLATIPVSIKDLFEWKKGAELSDKLNELPLRDINRAMGINDRMEIVNTLFGGQKQLFDQIIADLNMFKTFDLAQDLLGNGPAIQYKWDHEDRKEKAIEFIRLIRRRYL